MRKLAVVLLVLMVAIAVGAQIAEARRFYYYHPAYSAWGWWPFAPPLYYPEVYYVPPTVVIQQQPPPVVIQQPQTYIQRPPDPQPQEVVWYWCRKPEGFWPHIQRCEGDAWMKVLPSTAPPNAPK